MSLQMTAKDVMLFDSLQMDILHYSTWIALAKWQLNETSDLRATFPHILRFKN